MVLLDPLFHPPSTSSAIKTTDPHSPGPSACQVESEENSENTEVNPDNPEPADEGDIQIENSYD